MYSVRGFKIFSLGQFYFACFMVKILTKSNCSYWQCLLTPQPGPKCLLAAREVCTVFVQGLLLLVKAHDLLWSFYNYVIVWFKDLGWDKYGEGDEWEDVETLSQECGTLIVAAKSLPVLFSSIKSFITVIFWKLRRIILVSEKQQAVEVSVQIQNYSPQTKSWVASALIISWPVSFYSIK